MTTNCGVSHDGANLLLTFEVDTTAGKDFSWIDIDGNFTAATIVADNKVGKGVPGSRLLGKVISVSDELQSGTAVSALCTVQVTGIVRLRYAGGSMVKINDKVLCDGSGRVSPAIYPYYELGSGIVIAVDPKEQTCDVLL